MRTAILTPEQIGIKLKQTRIERGIAQNEFADMIDKSVRTLQKYETGEINMTLETMHDIASKLGLTLEELISEQQPGVEIQTYADLISSFIALDDADGIGIEIEEVTTKDNRKVLAVYCDAAKDEFLNNGKICDFLKEFAFYKNGKENGLLPEEIYNAWVKKTLIAADEHAVKAKAK